MDTQTFGSGGYEVTLTQSVTGAVVMYQTDDNVIIIPPEHVRAAALAMALCVHQLVPSAP